MSWTTVGSLSINWDTVTMSASKLDHWFSHVCLSPVPQTEPRPDGPNEQKARHFLGTAALDTKALVIGHKRSNCRVVLVLLQHEYVISGVPSLDA